MVNWWLISRAVVIEVSLARAFSQLGARLPAVDLLDHTSLAPFGRRGLRSVLLWMLYLSLFSLQYIMGRAEPILGLGLVFVVGIALAAFLLPVWGAHLRLRDAKAAELKQVHELLAVSPAPVGDLFGWTTAAIGDVSGDGITDIAVSAPFTDASFMNSSAGRIYALSGADGSVLFDGILPPLNPS